MVCHLCKKEVTEDNAIIDGMQNVICLKCDADIINDELNSEE